MVKKKKIMIAAAAVVLAGAIGTGVFLMNEGKDNKSQNEMAFVLAVSSMKDSMGAQYFAGVVEPQSTLDIQKNAERTVKDVYVHTGDEVEVGTQLFSYDTETLQAELAQSALELERIDNEMQNSKDRVAQLEKEKKDASEDEQLSYTTQIQTAQMDLKKSEYERKSKEVEIGQKENKVANSTVTSTMKGIIKSVNDGKSGDSASGSSQAFITILATGEYRVKGKVNEQNVGMITEGTRAVIRSRTDETKTWGGTFTAVDTKKPESSGGNSSFYMGMSSDGEETTSSSYPFYVTLDSSADLIMGQHVYIEQDMGQSAKKEGLWLDEGYIMDLDSTPFVWAEKDGKLEKRKVTLGEHDEGIMQYQIAGGLTEKDYIAFPQEFLEEGMKTTHEMTETGSSETAAQEDSAVLTEE